MGYAKKESDATLKNDYLFKRILGAEENKMLLQDFLECVLSLEHDDIEGLELLDKELKKDKAEEKTGILDIQVRLKSGMLIDVEMQAEWESFFVERSFAYLNKMYTSTLKAGESFAKKHRCVGINIIGSGFRLTDEIHSVASFRFEGSNIVVTDTIEMHFLNLEKVRSLPISKAKTTEERLINWLKMIDAEDKEDRRMLATTSPIFKLLNEKIEDVTRTPEEEMLFDSRMKMRSDILTGFDVYFNRGIEKGIEKGREEGRIEGLLTTAKNLLSMGLHLEDVVKATGLSKEELTKLQ